MHELGPPDDLLKRRDRDPILYVPAATFHCRFCDPTGPQGAYTTVTWMGSNTAGPSGRCTECGQKYALAATNRLEHLPMAVFDPCACAHLRGDHAPGRCRSCEDCDGFVARAP